ncbi:MAG: sigma 54-interacting transcriptional regulator, partial [Myxococcota bacterium]
PLTVLAAGSPPEPGTWWLVPEVGELDPVVVAPLRARLETVEPPLYEPAPRDVPRPTDPAFAGNVGRSAALCAVLVDAKKVAASSVPVVILAESGAGKEPLAHAIHAASGRKGPLVAIDLASRSANLVEDDLFGHVPRAFDGARGRDGAFKRAHGGTIFLDELGNLPLSVQAKLLRVLERREVQPLGSDALIPVDVRVIAATNADLESMVRLGEFRADLWHRLAGKVLRLPPLRARLDDVPALARHFLTGARHSGAITPAALDVLMGHAWPGNVRELAQVMGRAVLDADGDPIEPEHLGDLAPSRARRAPVLVTGDAAALDALPLPRRQIHHLRALTLTVEGPAQRGPACVRSAALHLLAGRAVTPEALRVLEAHPWWGGFVEMERKLRALAALPPGCIDPERIVACLPELGEVAGWDPILVVQHPVVGKDDAVGGLQASLAAAAVVVGRARRAGELEEGRAAWLRRLVGGGRVAFVPFPHLGALSRLHAVVTRLGDGLLVHRAPGARLEVLAGPVGGGVEPVREGGFVRVGEAGVVQIVGEGAPAVELYLFRGQVALRAAAPLLRVGDVDVRATAQAPGGAV